MRRFCFLAIAVLSCLLFSCTRPADTADKVVVEDTSVVYVPPTIAPLAILQAGEHPLWFQFTENGPILIETIEDACFSAALIPWPLAPHIRFILAQGKELLMAVNQDGFIRIAPLSAERVALYRFFDREFWRHYTVGAFILFNEQPTALLYRDDRFFDSSAEIPAPRLWTFDSYSARPVPAPVPSLDIFAPEDDWDIDTLRRGGDGHWYFRAVKKGASEPEILLLRSGDLAQEGEPVSLGPFQNAALPESLPDVFSPLREMLGAAFTHNGGGIAAVVSPEFKSARLFAVDMEKDALMGFYSAGSIFNEAFLVAIQPQGAGLYVEAGTPTGAEVIREFSLPPLPEGFIYTAIGMVGDTLVAAWEEQEGYSIGAAGFMALRFF